MADIRITDLPLATGITAPSLTDVVAIDGTTTRKTTVQAIVETGRPVASQAEAVAGSDAVKVMTALTVQQKIDSLNLGTAAQSSASDFASSAQGALASGSAQKSANLSDLASPAASRTNLGLGDSATRAVGATAGTVAAGDDARILNALPRNTDQSTNISTTVATNAIPPGGFGGLYLANAFASGVWTYLKNVSDATAGPRFLHSLASRVLGGHTNGPDQQRSVLWLLSEKLNWDSNTALSGEIDVATLQVRQGNLDDAGGILIDARKTFDTASTGGLTAIELASARSNFAGTVTSKVRTVVGMQEGLGGALNGNGASIYAEAEVGTNNVGVAILNYTGVFLHAIAGYLSRSPAARWFSIRWDGNPIFELGSPTDAMKFRYASSAILVQDETGALNHYVFAKDGIFRARAGLIPATGSLTMVRLLSGTAAVDIASTAGFASAASFNITVTGAAIGDSVILNVINNTYAGGNWQYRGEVTAANTVTVYPFNAQAAASDPASQTFKATVIGLA